MINREKIAAKANKIRNWLLGFGIVGFCVWWLIKLILCFCFGICIPF